MKRFHQLELLTVLGMALIVIPSVPAQQDKDDRLKRPTEILINANLEKVRSVIVQEMTGANYTLEKEDTYQLVFRKEIKGTAGTIGGITFSGGRNPHAIFTFVMTKEGEGVLLAEKVAILYPEKSGQGIPRNVDDKRTKKQIWENLDRIKAKAER